MCVNIDVFDIQKARNNTNNQMVKKSERFLLYMLMKQVNHEIDQNSAKGKGSCTVCYSLHNDDIPKEYWINTISEEFKSILKHKLTDAGYQILVDYISNRDSTINSIRIYIRWI